jgi:hypothetical protein
VAVRRKAPIILTAATHRSALKRFALAKRRHNPIFRAPLIGIETAWDTYRPSGDQSITGDDAISGS